MDTSITEIREEKLRLLALKRYEILDTPKDAAFERITRLAATYLKVPIAMISLVDEDRIWFKSSYGFELSQIGRESGLCSSAILGDELYVVENAAEDPRTRNNPLIFEFSVLQFYAALPLKTLDGHNIGTLCIIDELPRKLSENDVQVLTDLRDIIMELLEFRLTASNAVTQQRNLINMTMHDLKNPLASISLRAQFIARKKDEADSVAEVATQIKDLSSEMVNQINTLLLYSGKELFSIPANHEPVDMEKIISKVVGSSSVLASHKDQQITLELSKNLTVMGDEIQLNEVIDNLVSNAIKYCVCGGEIKITSYQSNNMAIIRVSDNGPGFAPGDYTRMFERFTQLSAKPTGGESSSGLGLSIVRLLVEQHGGRVYADENPQQQGAHMIVELPAMF